MISYRHNIHRPVGLPAVKYSNPVIVKKRISSAAKTEIHRLRQAGHTHSEIARLLGLTRNQVTGFCWRHKL